MYSYRPRRSTHSETPVSTQDTMQDNEQGSTTDAQESSWAPEEASDEQDGSISDMQTLLLFLLLVDRLAIAQGVYTPDMEGTIVESEPFAARAEDTRPHPTRRRTFPLLLLVLCIICSIAVVALYTVPLLTSSASVTIIPAEFTITTTTTVTTTAGRPDAAQQQIPGRLLSSLTLTQARTVPTTGTGHQDARAAHGSVTFYNGLPTAQTIAGGTLLTGADGVQIITDAPATIPGGTPPLYGQMSVAAHALSPGPQGNIAAGDINQVCCLTGVKAENTVAFGEGQIERDFTVVSESDIETATGAITTTLEKSAGAALSTQIREGEALTPPLCSEKVASDHQAGEEAKAVQVRVAETCTGLAYAAHTLYIQALQLLEERAQATLGAGYLLMGDAHVALLHTDTQTQDSATVTVKVAGMYLYHVSQDTKEHLSRVLAGKPQQQALAILLTTPGMQAASIQLVGGSATLPHDPTHIHITIVYQAG